MSEPVKDFMGREIKAGNTVVYPVRAGSKMWLQKMNVTQVNGGESPSLVGFNTGGRRITVRNIENVAVVESVT